MEPNAIFFRVPYRQLENVVRKKCELGSAGKLFVKQNLTLRTVVLSRHYITDFPLLNSYRAAILIVIALTVCHAFRVHHCKLIVVTGVVRI